MKTVVFRVDSGHHIGIGHIMRCLTLARVLVKNGCIVHFISKKHRGSLFHILSNEFSTFELGGAVANVLAEEFKNDYKYWLGTPEEVDLEKTNYILNEIGNVDLVIVDHYSLSIKFETGLNATKVMVIDDLCFREHVCHILLNQNLGVVETDYSNSKVKKYFLGPQYSLLRPEFSLLHDSLEEAVFSKDGVVKSCLVFFGFGDVGGNCLKLAMSLSMQEIDNYSFTFILNEHHSDYDKMLEYLKYKKIQVLSHSDDFSALMLKHDFFIGAGGATSWERACIGMPAAVVELAENQSKICQALEEHGWSFGLGRSEDLSKEKWEYFFQSQIKDKSTIKLMSRTAFLGVDGLGASRMGEAILGII